ncbi:MAG: lamin tail domain-containing protein, partial [Candidatus Marinimicrobia bacterium]|nr:lamin tail domain-containing protein [Candidatus Neomarinimicrobiota bacterium]
MKTIKSLIVCLFVLAIVQVSMGQIAITEFVNDPLGDDTDSGREYVEFFNYSDADVDIMNWVLKDEDNDSLLITTTSTIVPSGGFLLYASGKSAIETEWFGGVADDRIIEYGGPNSETMQLSNSGDELVLINSSGDTVWALAYTNDDLWDTTGTSDDGFNTYLSYYTDFTTHPSRWGTKVEPGIVRNGFDAGIARVDTTSTGADTTIIDSVLGYEGGAFTTDDFARLSLNGDSGSPLAGYYTQVSGKLRSNVKVAITEFLNDPLNADTDMGREYVELFNYGTEAVNIQNWTIKDEDHHTLGGNDWLVMTTDPVIIPAGGYLLFASLKDTIEAEYFGGVADDRIIEYGGPSAVTMQLSNSGDELMILDAVGDTVWNLA